MRRKRCPLCVADPVVVHGLEVDRDRAIQPVPTGVILARLRLFERSVEGGNVPGSVVVLNGMPRSGKTSIAKALQGVTERV